MIVIIIIYTIQRLNSCKWCNSCRYLYQFCSCLSLCEHRSIRPTPYTVLQLQWSLNKRTLKCTQLDNGHSFTNDIGLGSRPHAEKSYRPSLSLPGSFYHLDAVVETQHTK